mgnify:CR=1 FL=1
MTQVLADATKNLTDLTDPDAALTALGVTAAAKTLLVAATTALIRAAFGATAIGESLITAASATVARTALSHNKEYLPVYVPTLVGTGVTRIISPYTGTVTLIRGNISAALLTGNAVLTGKVNAATITNGAMTFTQAGSAAGDKFTATPTSNNTVTAGDELSLTLSGSQSNAAAFSNCYWEITRTA